MVRNWGGEGIEKFLGMNESVKLRFGDFFLTESRLGKYRTLSSTFEFTELSEISVEKYSGVVFPLLVSLIAWVGLSISSLLLYLSYRQGLLETLFDQFGVLVFGANTYYIWSYRRKNSFVVRSPNLRKNWKINTFRSKRGFEFVEELRNAIGR